MKLDDCYRLGEVIKTHGLKGEVSILFDVDSPDEYSKLESVFLLKDEKLIPFFIESIQIHSNKALVKFEDIDSVESGAELVKADIFLPTSLLPKLPEGGYYFHDLIGCQVYEEGDKIGTVKEVIDLNANQLLSVMRDEKEVLIPLKDQIIKKVDSENKRIDVELPKGLLGLYLD